MDLTQIPGTNRHQSAELAGFLDGATGLTPKQERGISVLLTAPTISEAAITLEVGERTIYTWLSQPAFANAYRAARREAVGQAIAHLHRLSSTAVNVLEEIMTDKKLSPATRRGAATAVLELGLRTLEAEMIEGRLEQIEEALAR